jgi:hypothetical protein
MPKKIFHPGNNPRRLSLMIDDQVVADIEKVGELTKQNQSEVIRAGIKVYKAAVYAAMDVDELPTRRLD